MIVYGERIDPAALPSLFVIAETLGLADRDGAGLLEIPAFANGRGLREAGRAARRRVRATPTSDAGGPGRGGAGDRRGRGRRRDHRPLPVRDRPAARPARPARSGSARSTAPALVVAHASVLTEGLAEHANVIFPADIYAEKDGTVVHPDGRLQRLRTAIGHPREVRAGWWVIGELATRCGLDLGVLTQLDGLRAAGGRGAVLRRPDAGGRSAAEACAGRSERRRRHCADWEKSSPRNNSPKSAHPTRPVPPATDRPPPRPLPPDLGLP